MSKNLNRGIDFNVFENKYPNAFVLFKDFVLTTESEGLYLIEEFLVANNENVFPTLITGLKRLNNKLKNE